MALETKRAAVNTAANAYTAALADLFDGLSPGDILYFCPITLLGSDGVAAATIDNTDGTALTGITNTVARQHRIRYEIKRATNIGSARYILPNAALAEVIGGLPFCFRVTNEAGELA